jgi:hypothetical protein
MPRSKKNYEDEHDDDNMFSIEEAIKDIKRSLPKKRVRRTKEQLKENYVDPIQMEKLIFEYYESGIMSNDLADMVQKIATRLGFAQNFINYSYKGEMIGDAIIKMITALTRKRFMCHKGYNPFSYFTKVAYRAFQNRIKKEKKEHDTIHRYQNEVYELLRENGQIPAQKNTHIDDDGTSYYRTENE